MRYRKDQISKTIKSDLQIRFAPQDISAHGGLELFRRYFSLIGLNSRIRKSFQRFEFSGDYSVTQVILVFIALWLTGGRRLSHIKYLGCDPLVERLCGLNSLPSDRTVSRWLKQFTQENSKKGEIDGLTFRRLKYYDMILGLLMVVFIGLIQSPKAQAGNDPGVAGLNQFNIAPIAVGELTDKLMSSRGIYFAGGGNDPGIIAMRSFGMQAPFTVEAVSFEAEAAGGGHDPGSRNGDDYAGGGHDPGKPLVPIDPEECGVELEDSEGELLEISVPCLDVVKKVMVDECIEFGDRDYCNGAEKADAAIDIMK